MKPLFVILNIVILSTFSLKVFSQPATAAPEPPAREASTVLSIFSDSYTSRSGTNLNPDWQQATQFSLLDIEGNQVIRYSNLNYQGMQLSGSIDVTGMDFLHIDLWTDNAASVNVYCISPGPSEKAYSLPITQGSWQSYDIPVSFFENVVDLSEVFQFKFDDGLVGNFPTIFLDNMYFYSGASSNSQLSELRIDGEVPLGFSPSVFEYSISLPFNSTEVPEVSVTPKEVNAEFSIQRAMALPGTTLVSVTAPDQVSESEYRVIFNLKDEASDVSLSNILVDGIMIQDFSPVRTNYVYDVPANEVDPPSISATSTVAGADVEVIPAESVPGTALINVISVDETVSQTYYVFIRPRNLFWWDEFNGTELDLSNWTYDIGAGNGWGNQELQNYTAGDNSFVENGLLNIVAEEEQLGGSNYTSARIKTQNKFSFQYGRIEARIKLPQGQGIWPAFWMLGSNISTVGWPACGEIDVMEMVGGQGRENTVHATLHWEEGGPGVRAQFGESFTLSSGIFADNFHVFSAEWDSTKVEAFVDGIKYYELDITTEERTEFLNDFFILLNVAVGGLWPGSPDETTSFPQTMQVDYVRVYKNQNPGAEIVSSGSSSVEAGAQFGFDVNASDVDGEVQKIIVFQNEIPVDTLISTPFQFVSQPLVHGCHEFTVRAIDDLNATGDLSAPVSVVAGTGCERQLFDSLSSPIAIPGRLDLTYFDYGGQDVAYHETSPLANSGADLGFRAFDAVDIGLESGTADNFVVQDIENGEWTSYSVNIDTPGVYEATLRYVSKTSRNSMSLYLDDEFLSSFRRLGGSDIFPALTEVSREFTIESSGEQILRIEYTAFDSLIIDHIDFVLLEATSAETEIELPSSFEILQNYPNPFNPSTLLRFNLNRTGFVKLSVFDLNGKRIRNLVESEMSAGSHQVALDASDLPSGIYIVRLQQGQNVATQRITLIK